MMEHEKEFADWLARQEREARERRIERIMQRLFGFDIRSTVECPCCCGRGRLEIILGAKDDE